MSILRKASSSAIVLLVLRPVSCFGDKAMCTMITINGPNNKHVNVRTPYDNIHNKLLRNMKRNETMTINPIITGGSMF